MGHTGGNPEPPPPPENHGPGSRFPPDPLPASPHHCGSAVPKAVESASTMVPAAVLFVISLGMPAVT
jgi:hypothetical protein